MGRWRQVGCWPESSPHVEFQVTERPCLKKPRCMASDVWGWFLASACIHIHMHSHTPEYAHTEEHGCLQVLVNYLFSYSKDVFSWRLLRTHCLDQLLQQARGGLFHPMIRMVGEQLVTSPAVYVMSFYFQGTWKIINNAGHMGNPSMKFEQSCCCLELLGSGGKWSDQTRGQLTCHTEAPRRGTLFRHVSKNMSVMTLQI